MIKSVLSTFLIFSFGLSTYAQKLTAPIEGAFIGAYTDASGGADQVQSDVIRKFEAQIGKKLVWNYFANNWLNGVIAFPWKSVQACDEAQTIPYIRMMPWTEMRDSGPDPYYKLERFLNGDFDAPLRKWAQEAKAYNKPLMVEFGPEVNGNWFAWNGKWNGGSETGKYGAPRHPDGPERFRDSYRRIIDLFREEGVENITWVFHVDSSPVPDAEWNRAKYYYPGDEYIDWIGLSVFGAQLPTHKWTSFRKKLARFWPQVNEISTTKPVLIAEFAVIEDKNIPGRKAQWLETALRTLRLDPQFRRIKAASYWNSPGWLPDAQADFRLTSSETALKSYRSEIALPYWIGRDQQESTRHD